jgi:hypothetical protein
MEFQRKWRKIDREFQRAAYNSKIQLTVSPRCVNRATAGGHMKETVCPISLVNFFRTNPRKVEEGWVWEEQGGSLRENGRSH